MVRLRAGASAFLLTLAFALSLATPSSAAPPATTHASAAPSATTHAAATTAAAPMTATALCQRVGQVGCCLGDRLLYCDPKAKLQAIDCHDRPLCGWRATGRYDCGTAGSADPSGQHPRLCAITNAALPKALRATPHPSICGAITEEGCCVGDELRFCREGKLHRISCRNNRFCGWRGVAQAYNCGTEGLADPRGKHPIACPGEPAPGPRHFPDAAIAVPSAGSSGCAGGSTCALSHDTLIPPHGLISTLLGLLALGFLRRRRRSKSRHPSHDASHDRAKS